MNNTDSSHMSGGEEDPEPKPVPEQGTASGRSSDERRGDGQRQNEPIGTVELECDMYNILLVSHPCSKAFLISSAVALVQVWLLILLVADLLKKEDHFAQLNPLKAPLIGNDRTVIVAQYIAIVIAVITQEDVIKTLGLIVTTFDAQSFQNDIASYETTGDLPERTFANPSRRKWIACNSMRCVMGWLTIVVSFLFIVQSDNILDMFMNFAAVAFVSELDNMMFGIAEQGFFGDDMVNAAGLVSALRLPVTKPHLGWIQRAVFTTTLTGLMIGLILVQGWQSAGKFLYDSSCIAMTVSFDGAVLELENPLVLTGTERDISLFANDILESSIFPTESGENVPSQQPPDLLYQYFSGVYIAFEDDMPFNRRPRYFQDGLRDDPTAGMIYYCDDDEAWVFTIPAMEHNLPKRSKNCQYGWLMQSPITEAASLEDAPLEGWNVWTGRVESMDIRISCNECFRDSDCGLENGQCNKMSRKCECDEGWEGGQCQRESTVCPKLGWVIYGQESTDFAIPEYLYTVPDPYDESHYALIYSRPAYTQLRLEDNTTVLDLLFYTGSRWVQAYWNESTFFSLYSEQSNFPIHAYWHLDRNSRLRFFSDPTDSITPFNLKWYQTRNSRSTGTSETAELYGANFEAEYVELECVQPIFDSFSVNDSVAPVGKALSTCGKLGVPDKSTGRCECLEGYAGLYCEFAPDGGYVFHQALSFVSAYDNVTKTADDSYQRNAFHRFFWDKWSDESLYAILKPKVENADGDYYYFGGHYFDDGYYDY